MKEEELKLSVEISNAVTSIVRDFSVAPKYVIAKGGITSSDVGTNGLQVKRATVLGQAAPGIPVWETDENSKFPHLPYIIFPGNLKTTSVPTPGLLTISIVPPFDSTRRLTIESPSPVPLMLFV